MIIENNLVSHFLLQLGKADGYQNEIIKYKEKLNELEFFKTRVDVSFYTKNVTLCQGA